MNFIFKNKKIILTAVFFLTLAVGFGLGKVEKANAARCFCSDSRSCDPTAPPCPVVTKVDASSAEECEKKCGPGVTSYFDDGTKITPGVGKSEDVCKNTSVFEPKTWINCLLIYVLRFLAGLLSVAASLFIWIIKPENITNVMKRDEIYQIWTLVRDFLNVSFILVLLFSAFCTVFQVENYNYKKILITLIIMALLVNFSFPISRIIIDFSNVIMYYLVDKLNFQSNGSFFVDFAKKSDLAGITTQTDAQTYTPSLIAAVVFTFIMAVTFLMVAILFYIRLVILTILVIFSSIAFVGSIVPFFSTYAKKWWDALFKYSFFGPVMIFMMVVSTKMMAAIGQGKGFIQNEAFAQSKINFVANMAFFAIPIIILWIGIGFAQQMSIIGASAVVGRGQKFMAGAGKMFSGYNWGERQYKAYANQRKIREEEKAKTRAGGWIGKKLNKAQDTAIGAIPFVGRKAKKRLKNVVTSAFDEDSKKASEGLDSQTTGNLVAHINSAANYTAAQDPHNRKAAIDFAANYKQLVSDPVRKTEFEANVRNLPVTQGAATAAATAASATAAGAGMSPAATTAYVQSMTEAAIQNEISQAWGNLKQRYQTVKQVHAPR
jgi:hypothetical protein